MKMNLTLIALATAAVFDASDIGNSHSLARDAGLGCSGLMLKSIIIKKALPLTEAGLGYSGLRLKSIFKKAVPLALTEVESPDIEVLAYESLKALLDEILKIKKSGGSLIDHINIFENKFKGFVADKLKLRIPFSKENSQWENIEKHDKYCAPIIEIVIQNYNILIGTSKEPHLEDLVKAKTRVSKELKKAQEKKYFCEFK